MYNSITGNYQKLWTAYLLKNMKSSRPEMFARSSLSSKFNAADIIVPCI